MTKTVRIENADNSSRKVKVYAEYLKDGQWVRSGETFALDYPAFMCTTSVYDGKRLVVEEYQ
jgi:hypothetical protein